MEYIYLHGFLSGPGSVKGVFLSRKFEELNLRLHRPDLNGSDFREMTISSQLEIVEHLLHSVHQEVTLIGSSLGGYLSALSASHGETVRNLVLMAPAFDFVERYFHRLTPEQLNNWRTTGTLKLYHYHHKDTRLLSYQMVEDARKYQGIPLTADVPTLIIHGIHDTSVPFKVSVDYLKGHSKTELILLNSDHGLLDKLDDIWRYMKEFLDFRDTGKNEIIRDAH